MQVPEGSQPATPTGGVSLLLRDTRISLGHDLASVAVSLRIRQPYLQAIEEGRFHDLPGATYAAGFVRGYAEFLGLDSKEILRRFKQENNEYDGRSQLSFPSAVSEGSIPNGGLLGFAILAALVAYGAWYWYSARHVATTEAVPPLPERLAALIHKPVGGSGGEVVMVPALETAKPGDGSPVAVVPPPPSGTAEQTASAPPAAPPGPEHEEVVPPAEEEPAGNGTASAPSPAPVQEVAAAPEVKAPSTAERKAGKEAKATKASKAKEAKPAVEASPGTETKPIPEAKPAAEAKPTAETKPAPETKPAAEAKPTTETKPTAETKPVSSGRVMLRASETCWVEIRDAAGQVVHSRLLHRGETYAVPSGTGLMLTVGNAGAINMVIDGRAAGALGRYGVVRHDIALDSLRPGEGVPTTDAPAAAAPPPGRPAE